MWDEDYRVLHEAVDKWHGVADEYKKLYDAAQLKIAKQHAAWAHTNGGQAWQATKAATAIASARGDQDYPAQAQAR